MNRRWISSKTFHRYYTGWVFFFFSPKRGVVSCGLFQTGSGWTFEKQERERERDARTGDICYLFRLSTVTTAHSLRLQVLRPSFPSVQQVTAHQTGFLFPRERDVSTWAQGGTGTRSRRGRPIESDRAPVRAEAKRTAGSACQRFVSALPCDPASQAPNFFWVCASRP